MTPQGLSRLRGALGFLVAGLLLGAAFVWVAVGEPYCQSANDSEDCPLEYDAQDKRDFVFAGGLVLLSLIGVAAIGLIQRRLIAKGGPRLRRLTLDRADRFLLGGSACAVLAIAWVYVFVHSTPSSWWLAAAWLGGLVAGLGTLSAGASLVIKPSSGIVQRWLAIPAIVLGVVGIFFNVGAWALAGMG